MSEATASEADAVLDFWFGAPGSSEFGSARKAWFSKDAAFDAAIRDRFGALIERALRGELDDWGGAPRSAIAQVLVLDQFTRNAFRDTPRAFAGDARALATAEAAIAQTFDASLALLERWFLYMPFQHSESRDTQTRSLELFAALARDGLPDPLQWAQRHHDIVARFGRFPHRNGILGRASTPEEEAFLREPGSRF